MRKISPPAPGFDPRTVQPVLRSQRQRNEKSAVLYQRHSVHQNPQYCTSGTPSIKIRSTVPAALRPSKFAVLYQRHSVHQNSQYCTSGTPSIKIPTWSAPGMNQISTFRGRRLTATVLSSGLDSDLLTITFGKWPWPILSDKQALTLRN